MPAGEDFDHFLLIFLKMSSSSPLINPFLIQSPSPPSHSTCDVNIIELSLHEPPKSLKRDLALIFGSSENVSTINRPYTYNIDIYVSFTDKLRYNINISSP